MTVAVVPATAADVVLVVFGIMAVIVMLPSAVFVVVVVSVVVVVRSGSRSCTVVIVESCGITVPTAILQEGLTAAYHASIFLMVHARL